MNLKRLDLPALVIGGPTASGKTEIALRVAEACGGEIVGADAFQIYEGLPVLTAQPEASELGRVRHHLVGTVGLEDTMDVQRYWGMAREALRSVWERGRLPILVGGTGLYVRTVLVGLAEGLPGPDPALREALEARSLESLCEELRCLDEVGAGRVDLKNRRRVVRALEVCLKTGRPFSSYRHEVRWGGGAMGIWVQWPRGDLRERIALRTGLMMERGVLEEVRRASPLCGATARQVLGLELLEAHLRGEMTLDDAMEGLVVATRQYAKRQETWFRREAALLATGPEEAQDAALGLLRERGLM